MDTCQKIAIEYLELKEKYGDELSRIYIQNERNLTDTEVDLNIRAGLKHILDTKNNQGKI